MWKHLQRTLLRLRLRRRKPCICSLTLLNRMLWTTNSSCQNRARPLMKCNLTSTSSKTTYRSFSLSRRWSLNFREPCQSVCMKVKTKLKLLIKNHLWREIFSSSLVQSKMAKLSAWEECFSERLEDKLWPTSGRSNRMANRKSLI